MRTFNPDFPLRHVAFECDWPATANQAKAYFGLKPSDRWPAEGIAPRQINGYFFYVKALVPLEERRGRDPRWPNAIANPNRFMAVCPCCDRHISYGCLAQHMKVHQQE
jgi:hypothetical protein